MTVNARIIAFPLHFDNFFSLVYTEHAHKNEGVETMEERTQERVIEILNNAADLYVPVKRLWLLLHDEGWASGLDLPALTMWLAADGRFELIEGHGLAIDESDPLRAAEVEAELEALGFFGGPRVKLTDRQMSTEEVFARLARSLQQLSDALQGAQESLPSGNPEAAEMFHEALKVAQELENQVQDMVDKQQS